MTGNHVWGKLHRGFESPSLRHLISVIALFVTLPAALAAQTPVGPGFSLNSYTTSYQGDTRVAALPDGGFVAVWSSFGQDGDSLGVVGRRFGPDGSAGPEFPVSNWTTQAQWFAAVASDRSGNFVVVWEDSARAGGMSAIFGQRFDATGARVGAEFQVSTTVPAEYPDVAFDGSGNFVVVWDSWYAYDGADVFARVFDATAGAFGPEVLVNAYTTGNQKLPAVAVSADGEFTVVWQQDPTAAPESHYQTWARHFSAAGSPLTDGVELNVHTEYASTRPDVAALPDGSAIVVWRGGDSAGDPHIMARRFDGRAGGSLGPAFTVTAPGAWPSDPAIAAAPSGGFVVAWEEGLDKDGNGLGVIARRYDRAGFPAGSEFQVNTYTTDSQSLASVAAVEDGRFMVAWSDPVADGSNFGAFGRIFDDLIFADGFESGDLSAWSASRTDLGDLEVDGAGGLAGTDHALRGTIDDTAGLYVEDGSPADERRYRARFYLDPTGYDPGEASGRFRTRVFILFQDDPMRRLASVVLKRQSGAYSVRVRCRLDDNRHADSAFVSLPAVGSFVEIDWQASTPGVADGQLTLWTDGVLRQTLTGLDNDLSAVDFVRFGALSVKPGASGTLIWDEFVSRRGRYIGAR